MMKLTFSEATGCIYLSSCQSTTLKHWKILFWKTWLFIPLSGNLVGYKSQHLNMLVVFLENPIQVSPKLPTALIPTRSQRSITSVCKVTLKHVAIQLPFLGILMGWNWQKCDFLMLFTVVNLLPSESTGCFLSTKLSKDGLMVLYIDNFIFKVVLDLPLCSEAWFCQK